MNRENSIIEGKNVTVGSLKEQKNHKLLINAINEVIKTHPDIQLYIYGEGWLRPELEGQVKELELVVFLPRTKVEHSRHY